MQNQRIRITVFANEEALGTTTVALDAIGNMKECSVLAAIHAIQKKFGEAAEITGTDITTTIISHSNRSPAQMPHILTPMIVLPVMEKWFMAESRISLMTIHSL